MQLSKSDYLMFLKHPAWLWLKKHDKDKLPPFDDRVQAILDAGKRFEQYAEALFPGGVKLGSESYAEYRTLPARTEEALASGAETIFQGRFEHGELTCIVDVLERGEGGRFNLYEIKSGSSDKPEYLEDLAFQTVVLEGAGLELGTIGVIVVNSQYVREGAIDPQGIAKMIDVSDRVRSLLPNTKETIKQALACMKAPECPDISPRHAHQQYLKEWLEIFHTLKLDTDPYSIYALSPPNRDLIGELEDQGLARIEEIPESSTLTTVKHRRQVELTKLGEPVIDREKIREFLDTFQFPLAFFDYETMSDVVPPLDGLRPYQQFPMQYSLHILRQPGGELEHFEFLHREATSPGPALCRQLQEEIGEEGTVLVWNERFEKQCNDDLGALHPEFAAFLASLNGRVVDLMTPFAKGWYEDYRFLGSASIKKVLPVLVPELSYTDLAVQEGQTAQRLWMETILEGKHVERREKILADLLAYCELDTLAMVRIYEHLARL